MEGTASRESLQTVASLEAAYWQRKILAEAISSKRNHDKITEYAAYAIMWGGLVQTLLRAANEEIEEVGEE